MISLPQGYVFQLLIWLFVAYAIFFGMAENKRIVVIKKLLIVERSSLGTGSSSDLPRNKYLCKRNDVNEISRAVSS